MRRAAKVDANQPAIVKLFRKLGWSVLIISQLKNCCDIIVSKYGSTIAVEIKDGALAPSQRQLTEGEAKFAKEWQGHFLVIKSEDDVLALNKVTLQT